jgi:hypothetical protein
MTVYTYSFLSNAARDAVRYAIVRGSKSTSPASSDDIQTYVRNEAQGINPSALTVQTSWNPNNSLGSTVRLPRLAIRDFFPLQPFGLSASGGTATLAARRDFSLKDAPVCRTTNSDSCTTSSTYKDVEKFLSDWIDCLFSICIVQ